MRINAAARLNGLSYSNFLHLLKEKGVDLDRKVLADLAVNNPSVFEDLVKYLKKYSKRWPWIKLLMMLRHLFTQI